MAFESDNSPLKAIADLGTQYRETIDRADRAETIRRVSSTIAKGGLGLFGIGAAGLIAFGATNKDTAPTFAYVAAAGVTLGSVAATTSVFAKHAAQTSEARAEDIALDQDIACFLIFGAGSTNFHEPGAAELE